MEQDRNRWDDLADKIEADPKDYRVGCWSSVDERIAFYRSVADSVRRNQRAVRED